MADDQQGQASVTGSGPLYQQSEAAQKAAEEPVEIPASPGDEQATGHPGGSAT